VKSAMRRADSTHAPFKSKAIWMKGEVKSLARHNRSAALYPWRMSLCLAYSRQHRCSRTGSPSNSEGIHE
jgi:hypothetical protein